MLRTYLGVEENELRDLDRDDALLRGVLRTKPLEDA